MLRVLNMRSRIYRTATRLLPCFILLCFLQTARATTLVHMSLEQLSQASSDIVRGRVVAQASAWNASHTLIDTITRIAVDQRIKGQAPQFVHIEQPGGKIGNLRVYVPGTVHFLPGGRYFLFLEPNRATPSHYLVVGMIQGAYRIYQDAATGEERVIRPMGSMFYGPARPLVTPTAPLKEFRQEMSSAVSTPPVVPAGTLIIMIIQTVQMNGVGNLEITGRTTTEIFPNAHAVIPAGSLVKGVAQEQSGSWAIHWTDVVVRGTRVGISAASKAPAQESLQGKTISFRAQAIGRREAK